MKSPPQRIFVTSLPFDISSRVATTGINCSNCHKRYIDYHGLVNCGLFHIQMTCKYTFQHASLSSISLFICVQLFSISHFTFPFHSQRSLGLQFHKHLLYSILLTRRFSTSLFDIFAYIFRHSHGFNKVDHQMTSSNSSFSIPRCHKSHHHLATLKPRA